MKLDHRSPIDAEVVAEHSVNRFFASKNFPQSSVIEKPFKASPSHLYELHQTNNTFVLCVWARGWGIRGRKG